MSTDLLHQKLTAQLDKRKKEGLYRSLKKDAELIDFCSNDYLGLSCNQELQERIHKRSSSVPANLGATGSRLLTGNSNQTERLEEILVEIHQTEAALLCTSGYSANLSIFSAIPQKGDTIIYDELIHVCIKDGARLSFAERKSFKHNDIADLERKLSKSEGNVFVAVESIYSMDGDMAPLQELARLCKKYSAYLIVDEAHSTGLWGSKGSGLCTELGIVDDVFARIHTFGKAIGSHGACIVGSKVLKEYLINYARPFIFTTASSDHNLITVEEAFHYLGENPSLWKRLQSNIKLYRSLIQKESIHSLSAIQAVMITGNKEAKKAALHIQKKGFDVRPILSPTVKKGTERIRICLHAYNTEQEIIELVNLINEV
ncbi:MAG: aminotransferase class I/II-fold pyridoxal phosphate-dependent enzyme [Cyclobacteriaceae bacterium]